MRPEHLVVTTDFSASPKHFRLVAGCPTTNRTRRTPERILKLPALISQNRIALKWLVLRPRRPELRRFSLTRSIVAPVQDETDGLDGIVGRALHQQMVVDVGQAARHSARSR